MIVQFSDATETTIIAAFGCSQNATAYPNQGTVTASDARWAAYYATLPASAQMSLPAPTTPIGLTLAQSATTAIGAGLTITLSGTLTLAATLFPTDPKTQTKLNTVVNELNTSGTFFGAATGLMKDAATPVVWHSFTPAQYKAVASAIGAYVAALDMIVDGNPMNATALPQNSVSLTV